MAKNGIVSDQFNRFPDIQGSDYLDRRMTFPWPEELKKEPHVFHFPEVSHGHDS